MGGAAFLLVLGLILLWVVWTGKARRVKDALFSDATQAAP